MNPCTSFQSCSMCHFETTTIWTSEFSQYVTIGTCYLVEKKAFPPDFQQFNHFKYQKMCLCTRMLAPKWKERPYIEKVSSGCFVDLVAIFVYQNCTQIWRLHTKLYNGAWHVSAKNSETVDLIDLRLGQIVYISVFKTFRFLGFFHWTVSNLFFLCCVYCVKVKTIYRKPFDALLGSLETLRSWVPLSRALRIPTPWCSCRLYSDRFIILKKRRSHMESAWTGFLRWHNWIF